MSTNDGVILSTIYLEGLFFNETLTIACQYSSFCLIIHNLDRQLLHENVLSIAMYHTLRRLVLIFI